ncbi:MAG: DUF2807 domain-containing protein [Bacteroidales bacterium]|nr:DUF2807 domain-containing protein [Bacteroidales bacterium]
MRSKIIFLSIAAFFLFGNVMQAQNFTKQERKTGPFSAIQINCSADVYLTQGNNQSVVVETENSNQDKIITEVDGNTLVIKTKPYTNLYTKRLRVYVETSQIKSLAVNGSGDIHTQSIRGDNLNIAIKGSGDVFAGELQLDQLQANIMGSGDLSFSGKVSGLKLNIRGSGDTRISNIESSNADFSIQGSGDVMISGKADQATIWLQGSGDFKGSDFTVSKAVTNQLGSGDVHMTVNDNLTLTIKGSGDFYLGGNPKVINSEIRGSGELHR